ncbi:hypothetical protein FOZ63_024940, partial [Perkinsus olseni]
DSEAIPRKRGYLQRHRLSIPRITLKMRLEVKQIVRDSNRHWKWLSEDHDAVFTTASSTGLLLDHKHPTSLQHVRCLYEIASAGDSSAAAASSSSSGVSTTAVIAQYAAATKPTAMQIWASPIRVT